MDTEEIGLKYIFLNYFPPTPPPPPEALGETTDRGTQPGSKLLGNHLLNPGIPQFSVLGKGIAGTSPCCQHWAKTLYNCRGSCPPLCRQYIYVKRDKKEAPFWGQDLSPH